MGTYDIMVHSHSLFWLIAFITFTLSVVFSGKGKAKPAKIMHMILRLCYILLLITGISMIVMNFYWATFVKGLLAFWLIFMMELIAVRSSKGILEGRQKTTFWIGFAAAVTLVFIFGYGVTG
ncbi:YisL family protein [Alkalicoccus urumqiensis]|uniref:DUF1516 domain-containing protein n=1 Tax=Alkalicoccus urumqiensis TaxID=1548213 RepID=A0A2P6MF16_ALKUR|nr:YisL family protein [Alkalicoccus urumqiensis]PRO64876.1 DUF1516 domain-containing protein [Alkalicoccus urumqiensis]